MNKLKNHELINIYGGSNTLTSAFINSISKCLDTLLEVGRAIGSAINRFSTKNICP